MKATGTGGRGQVDRRRVRRRSGPGQRLVHRAEGPDLQPCRGHRDGGAHHHGLRQLGLHVRQRVRCAGSQGERTGGRQVRGGCRQARICTPDQFRGQFADPGQRPASGDAPDRGRLGVHPADRPFQDAPRPARLLQAELGQRRDAAGAWRRRPDRRGLHGRGVADRCLYRATRLFPMGRHDGIARRSAEERRGSGNSIVRRSVGATTRRLPTSAFTIPTTPSTASAAGSTSSPGRPISTPSTSRAIRPTPTALA